MLKPSPSLDSIAQECTNLVQNMNVLSESYYYLGKLDEALKVLESGMTLLELAEMRQKDQVQLLLQYGKVLIKRRYLIEQADSNIFPVLSRAKQIAESLRDNQSLAHALDLIGQAYFYDNMSGSEIDFDTPLSYFEQVLELREVLHDKRVISESLFYMGLIYDNKEQWEKAQELYTEALQVADKHGYKAEQSFPERHLGLIYLEQGNLDKARLYLAESLSLRESAGFKLYFPYSHIAVGNVCVAQNDFATALLHYQEAHKFAEELNLKIPIIMSLISLGDMYQLQKEYSQALEYFEKAHSVALESGIQRGIAEATARIEGISKD